VRKEKYKRKKNNRCKESSRGVGNLGWRGRSSKIVTNFIQLVSPQPVDRFSQTKLHWKAPNKGYPYICRMYKSDNK